MAGPRETVSLEAFLSGLPGEAAAEARAAAAQIDALEREIGPPGWIERHFFGLAAAALALFVLGLGGLAGMFAGWPLPIGLGGVVLLLAAFPGLMLVYLLAVRGQTRLDDAKMALNSRHFLPHGGLYFGAPQGGGKVLRVEKPVKDAPDLRQRTQMQYEAATKRRWWW